MRDSLKWLISCLVLILILLAVFGFPSIKPTPAQVERVNAMKSELSYVQKGDLLVVNDKWEIVMSTREDMISTTDIPRRSSVRVRTKDQLSEITQKVTSQKDETNYNAICIRLIKSLSE